ncbi:MAG: membrane protein insertase YidC, partial [bacterium]
PSQEPQKRVVSEPTPVAPQETHSREVEIKVSQDEQDELPKAPTAATFILERNGHTYKFDNFFRLLDAKTDTSVIEFHNIVGSETPFAIYFQDAQGFRSEQFSFEKTNPYTARGTNSNGTITANLVLLENGKVAYSISSNTPLIVRTKWEAPQKALENRQVRNFVWLADDLETVAAADDDDEGEYKVNWQGIDFNYHLVALGFNSKPLMQVNVTEAGAMTSTTVRPQAHLEGFIIFAKKEYDYLINLGEKLHLAVDFGIWSILAVPILRVLQFFYKYIPNYGVAIILITLLLRLLTFPLQYKSLKSMNKMKTIQPELNKLKDKYKDDPQRMQKETMEFFKKTGYNPMGGCLPILLQIPIFFAFYRVLYNAVELVNAPFVGWIHDLSSKDPYYVLPVLMGVSFFLQQKLTPTPTADPAQKKMMMFLPLIFVFIMKDLPAGLTLYIFISTLMGIGQQTLLAQKKA